MVIYEKNIWNGERKKIRNKTEATSQAKQSISQYNNNKKMKQGNIKKCTEVRSKKRIPFLAYILLSVRMDIGGTMALR